MRLYTRTGDDGTTGLFGGGRVTKDHPRVDAYGEVDELNACIGLALAAIASGPPVHKPGSEASPVVSPTPVRELIREILTALQSKLFDLGADLATPAESRHEAKVQRITQDHVAAVEKWIDEIDSGNAPLTAFILPGGSELAARLHLARTVSRRAERAMVHLGHLEPVNPQAVIYMNRVSDMLFAMARLANRDAGVEDIQWHARG